MAGVKGFALNRRISAAKTKEFEIIDKFGIGYRNREDLTKLPPGVLIPGSQNVLTNVSGRVGNRKGYTLDGTSQSDNEGVSFDQVADMNFGNAGFIKASVKNSNYIFTTLGNTFQIINVLDPVNPTVSSTVTPPGVPMALDISADGNTLYIGTEDNNLYLYDVSDKTAPVQKGTIACGDTWPNSNTPNQQVVKVLSPTTVLLCLTSGVQAVDVSDVNTPFFTGTPIAGTFAGIKTNNGKLYAFTILNSAPFIIAIYDMASLSSPVLLGSTPSPFDSNEDYHGDIGVQGNLIYASLVSAGDTLNHLVIYDASDFTSIAILSDTATAVNTGNVIGLAVEDVNLVIVDGEFDSITLFNVSNVSVPISAHSISQGAFTVLLAFPYFYVGINTNSPTHFYTYQIQTEDTNAAPILSSYDWQVQDNGTRHLRAGFLTNNNGKLQVRTVSSTGEVVWVNLITNLSSTKFNFTSWFNTSNKQDLLLFVNGTSQIYEWSGGFATLSATSFDTGVISALNASTPSNPVAQGAGYKVGDILDISGGTGGQAKVTTVLNGAVSTYTFGVHPGHGYQFGDVLTIQSGNHDAQIVVTSVDGSGVITGSELITGGTNYGEALERPVTGGHGADAEVDITLVVDGALSTVSLETNGTGYSTGAANTTGGSGSGGQVYISSVVQGFIEISGDLTVAQLNFYNSGSVIINGHAYSYTAINGNYFVGIDISPTGEAIGSLIIQSPIVTKNADMQGLPETFANQLISTLNNQIYVGALNSNQVYVAKNSNYKDFTSSSPRLPGDGALLTLDSPAVAFVVQESDLYISAGLDEWYQTSFTLSADLVNETLNIVRLKTTTGQGTQSQALTGKIPDNVIFVSNEPIIDTLGRVSNVVLTPQVTDISYTIVNDINSYNFTDGAVFYFQKYIYVAVPKQSIVRIYNMTNVGAKSQNYWEAPQILPLSRFSIIDGELYGHSYQTSETYKLFTGYNDNGHPYISIAAFSYQQDGVRSASKSFNEFYVEGYIDIATTLTLGLNYDLDGFQTQTSYEIDGSDSQVVGIQKNNASLGKSSLGKNPLGGNLASASLTGLPPKFRVIKTFPRTPYYEYQPLFKTDGLNQQWQIIGFGGATSPTTEDNSPITE